MAREKIIVLSIICCIFGVLALTGPDDYRAAAYGINAVLALVAFALAGRDLLSAAAQTLGPPVAGAARYDRPDADA